MNVRTIFRNHAFPRNGGVNELAKDFNYAFGVKPLHPSVLLNYDMSVCRIQRQGRSAGITIEEIRFEDAPVELLKSIGIGGAQIRVHEKELACILKDDHLTVNLETACTILAMHLYPKLVA